MRIPRQRFACPPELYREAKEYAKLDGRTFSELVGEALRQHMRRYPKALHAVETDLDVLADKVAAKLALQVHAGTLQGNGGGGS